MSSRAFHPFLIGIFPILFLFAQNSSEMNISETVFPLLLSVLTTLILMILLRMVIGSALKRAMVVSASLLMFFSYGHILGLAIRLDISIAGDSNLIILPLWALVLALIVLLILKSKSDMTRITRFLNLTAALLVVFQLVSGGYALIRGSEADTNRAPMQVASEIPENLPDIYYIILDGYGRQDILAEIYNIDNSDFLDQLRNRGFKIADGSFSNYCATLQSLTSTLNLDYIQDLGNFREGSTDRGPLVRKLAENRVFRTLKAYGYKTIAFASGHTPTQLKNADYYLEPGITISEFQNILLNYTPLPFVLDGFSNQFDLHRDRISYILGKVGALDRVEEPKFVFAHILSPHPPFVFDRNGDAVQRDWPFSFADGDHFTIQGGTIDEYVSGYADQCLFISQKLPEVIDNILAVSDQPPIIIIQGDHGPGSGLSWSSAIKTDMHERFSILNAYHLPGIDNTAIPRSITPINSFRMILNLYFDGNYDMLPEYSYYSTRGKPYRFLDVTGHLQGAE